MTDHSPPRFHDPLAGVELPLLPNYAPTPSSRGLSLLRAGSLITGYGAQITRSPPRELLDQVHRMVVGALASLRIPPRPPSVREENRGYTLVYPLPHNRLVVHLNTAPMTQGLFLARYYALLEGEEDPSLLQAALEQTRPAPQARARQYSVVDPETNMPAAFLTLPHDCSISARVNPNKNIQAHIQCPQATIIAEPREGLEPRSPLAPQVHALLYPGGRGELAPYTPAPQLLAGLRLEWAHAQHAPPPGLFLHQVASAMAMGQVGIMHRVDSSLAWAPGEAVWATTLAISLPTGDMAWAQYTVHSTGPWALEGLLTLMAHSWVNPQWVKRVLHMMSRARRRAAPSQNVGAGAFTQQPPPIPPQPPALLQPWESDPGTLTASGVSRDAASDPWDEPSHWTSGSATDSYDDSMAWGEGDPGGRDFAHDSAFASNADTGEEPPYRDDPYPQFYLDEEGRVRYAGAGDDPTIAYYVDDWGVLRDEEHKPVAQLHHGQLYDPETGEYMGTLNWEQSDRQTVERLEENLLNPEETLGQGPYNPREHKTQIDTMWVTDEYGEEDEEEDY